MEYPRIIQLLKKQREKELSVKESAELKQWLESHPEEASAADDLRRTWTLAGRYKEGYTPDVEGGLRRFQQRVADPAPAPKRRAFAVGVVVLLLLLLAAWGIWRWMADRPAPGPVAEQTQPGEKRSVTLPDGSVVTLNENSHLNYSENWSTSGQRQVELTGEALFEVKENSELPFVVLTRYTEIQVLGTAFNVRAYSEEPLTEIVVKEGTVQFATRDHRQRLVLEADDKGFCEENGSMTVEKRVGLNPSPWLTETLAFRNTPMHEVARSLEHYFDVELDLSPSDIDSCPFTHSTIREEGLGELIEVLEVGLDARVEQTGPRSYRVISDMSCSE